MNKNRIKPALVLLYTVMILALIPCVKIRAEEDDPHEELVRQMYASYSFPNKNMYGDRWDVENVRNEIAAYMNTSSGWINKNASLRGSVFLSAPGGEAFMRLPGAFRTFRTN